MATYSHGLLVLCVLLALTQVRTDSVVVGSAISSPNPAVTQQIYAKFDQTTTDKFYVVITESSTYTQNTFFFTSGTHVVPPIIGVFLFTAYNSTHMLATIPPLGIARSAFLSFQYFRSSGSLWNIIGFPSNALYSWPVGNAATSQNYYTIQGTNSLPSGSNLPYGLNAYMSIMAHALLISQATEDVYCTLTLDIQGVLRGFFLDGKNVVFDSSVNLDSHVTIQSSSKILIKALRTYLVTVIGVYIDISRIIFTSCQRSTSTSTYTIIPAISALSSTPTTKTDVAYTVASNSGLACPTNCIYCLAENYPSSTVTTCYNCSSGYYIYGGNCVTTCTDPALLIPSGRQGTCDSTIRSEGFVRGQTTCGYNNLTTNLYLDIWTNTSQALSIYFAGQPTFGNNPIFWLTSSWVLPEDIFLIYNVYYGSLAGTQTGIPFQMSNTTNLPFYVAFYDFNNDPTQAVAVVGYYGSSAPSAGTQSQATSVTYAGFNQTISLYTNYYYRIQTIANCVSCSFFITANGYVEVYRNGRTFLAGVNFGTRPWTLAIQGVYTGVFQFTFVLTGSSSFNITVSSSSWTPITPQSIVNIQSTTLQLGSSCYIPNCINCNGATCLSCASGYYLDVNAASCVTSCGSNYAISIERRCLTYIPYYILWVQNSYSIPRCSPGYYFTSSNGCDNLCNANCYECIGPNPTDCFICTGSKVLSGGQCVCPPGASQNASTLACYCPTGLTLTTSGCISCSPACGTCNGPTDQNCTSCASPRTLNGTQCICPPGTTDTPSTRVCQCPSGMFADYTGCYACFSTCTQCFGSNINNCNACTLPRVLNGTFCQCPSGTIDDYSTGQCGCPTGYFLNNQVCTKCYSGCSTCSSTLPNGCLSCLAPRTLANGFCSCPSGSTDNSATGSCDCASGTYSTPTGCAACDPTCGQCSGPSNTQCTACNDPRSFQNGKCACAPAAYDNQTSGSCSCGNYFYPTTTTCASCDNSCLTCAGPANTDCLTCPYPRTFNNGQCTCPSGSAPDANGVCQCTAGSNSVINPSGCQTCDPRCQTCSGPSSNQCLSCPNGMVLINTQCFCRAGVFTSASRTCGCSVGQYPTFEQCSPCDSSCYTCSGPTALNCTSCNSPFELQANYSCGCPASVIAAGRSCDCPDGQYLYGDPNTQSNPCKDCDKSCDHCSGPLASQCTACTRLRYFDSNHNCVCLPDFTDNPTTRTCDCPSGFYEKNKECVECQSPRVVVDGNQCSCPDGMYDVDGNCVSCHSTCKTCSGPYRNQCLTCYEGLIVDPNLGRCVNHGKLETYVAIYSTISAVTLLPVLAAFIFFMAKDFPLLVKKVKVPGGGAAAGGGGAAGGAGATLTTEMLETETGAFMGRGGGGGRGMIEEDVEAERPRGNTVIGNTKYNVTSNELRGIYEKSPGLRMQLDLLPQKPSNVLKRFSPFTSIILIPNMFYSRITRLMMLMFYINWKLYTVIVCYSWFDYMNIRGDPGSFQAYIVTLIGELLITGGISIIVGGLIKCFLSSSFRRWRPEAWSLITVHVIVLLCVLFMIAAAIVINYLMLSGYGIWSRDFNVICIFIISLFLVYVVYELIVALLMGRTSPQNYTTMRNMRFCNVFDFPIIDEFKYAGTEEERIREQHNYILRKKVEQRRRNFEQKVGGEGNFKLRSENYDKIYGSKQDLSPEANTATSPTKNPLLGGTFGTEASLIQTTERSIEEDNNAGNAGNAGNFKITVLKSEHEAIKKSNITKSTTKKHKKGKLKSKVTTKVVEYVQDLGEVDIDSARGLISARGFGEVESATSGKRVMFKHVDEGTDEERDAGSMTQLDSARPLVSIMKHSEIGPAEKKAVSHVVVEKKGGEKHVVTEMAQVIEKRGIPKTTVTEMTHTVVSSEGGNASSGQQQAERKVFETNNLMDMPAPVAISGGSASVSSHSRGQHQIESHALETTNLMDIPAQIVKTTTITTSSSEGTKEAGGATSSATTNIAGAVEKKVVTTTTTSSSGGAKEAVASGSTAISNLAAGGGSSALTNIAGAVEKKVVTTTTTVSSSGGSKEAGGTTSSASANLAAVENKYASGASAVEQKVEGTKKIVSETVHKIETATVSGGDKAHVGETIEKKVMPSSSIMEETKTVERKIVPSSQLSEAKQAAEQVKQSTDLRSVSHTVESKVSSSGGMKEVTKTVKEGVTGSYTQKETVVTSTTKKKSQAQSKDQDGSDFISEGDQIELDEYEEEY